VMGLDYRDWEAGEGPPRTDTMILLTVDPLMKTAGIMNIPRDLWVNIPGSGYGKINTAYPIGEGFRMPGGGPGNAVRTVEQFLGVPINYYAQIDFFAFERFIDEIGGVEVNVPEEIKVDPIGPGNTVFLEPGKQTLDGPVALAYARARNSEGADFDRAARQQQVILAILDRLLSVNALPTLVSKAPLLYRELASGVHTNMTLEQAISMAWLAPGIPRESIKRGIIGPPEQVLFAKSPDGSQDILKPIPSKIRLLRDDIFAPEVFSPVAAALDAESLLREEQANISVLNGSGAGGLAARTAEYLTELGANVLVTGDAGQFYQNTTVVDYTGNPYTVRFLAELMNIQPAHIRFEFNPDSELDVVVFLGATWAGSNPMP
jgi:polyisoprenyl-teichoic acid--peptidoglycan teichoic acid transferase